MTQNPEHATSAPAGRDEAGYADLSAYAAIGDGRTVALVASDGRIDWMPVPELDSEVPFGALIDAAHGGYIGLCPDEPFTTTREYAEGSNVLVTTFTTDAGVVRVTDSLNTGVAGRLPWLELARRIDGVSGEVAMTGTIALGTCFATAAPWARETVHGTVLRVDSLTLAPRTLNDDGVEVSDDGVVVAYRTREGSRHVLGLVATGDEPLFLATPEDLDAGVDRTIESWQRWSRAMPHDGPWAEHVTRSALLLKLLISAPSGAMAAAATTSLPESLDGYGPWDYRFAWVRDTAYSLTALFRFGVREETHAAISWMMTAIHGTEGDPAVFYRLDGSRPDGHVEELHAPGWRGLGQPVAGNRAADQLQLGVFGDIFSVVHLYVEHGNVLDDRTSRILTGIADRAADSWRRVDSGMWELPETQHYTASKLGCWQALTHAAHLAEQGQIDGDAGHWRREADRIRAWVDEHAWDEELGSYVSHPGSKQLDTAVLLHCISGFDRGPRMSSTIDVLRRELGEGPHLYRFTGSREQEAAFVACAFWVVSALALVGRVEEARDLMDELVQLPNDVGVMTEMVVPGTGQFLGNLPQALSHLALVHAALTLTERLEGEGD